MGPKKEDICSECGVSLEDRDRRAHALSHWPDTIPREKKYNKARKRQAQVLGDD